MQDLAGEEGADYRSMIPHDLRENKKISSTTTSNQAGFRHLIRSMSSPHLSIHSHCYFANLALQK